MGTGSYEFEKQLKETLSKELIMALSILINICEEIDNKE